MFQDVRTVSVAGLFLVLMVYGMFWLFQYEVEKRNRFQYLGNGRLRGKVLHGILTICEHSSS